MPQKFDTIRYAKLALAYLPTSVAEICQKRVKVNGEAKINTFYFLFLLNSILSLGVVEGGE